MPGTVSSGSGSAAANARTHADRAIRAFVTTASAVIGRPERRAFTVAAGFGAVAHPAALAAVELVIVQVDAPRAATGQFATGGAAVPAVGIGIQAFDHVDAVAFTTAKAIHVAGIVTTAAVLALALDPAPTAREAPLGERRDTVAALPPLAGGVPGRSTDRAEADAAVVQVGGQVDASHRAPAVRWEFGRALTREAVADRASLRDRKRIIEAVAVVAAGAAVDDVVDGDVATPLPGGAGRVAGRRPAGAIDARLLVRTWGVAASTVVVVAPQVDARRSALRIGGIGTGALAIDAGEVALAGVATPAAVRVVIPEIHALGAALVAGASLLFGTAGAVDARGASTRVPAAPAVARVRLRVHAGLAAPDPPLLALLLSLALLALLAPGVCLVRAGRDGQRRRDGSAQQRAP
jgi:hypothetical protein